MKFLKKEYDDQGRLIRTSFREEVLTDIYYDYEAENKVVTERAYKNHILVKVTKTFEDLPEEE